MSLVADTGPLIALAKINRLDLLEQLFGEVFITPSVHRELLAKSGPEADRLDDALSRFVKVSENPKQTPDILRGPPKDGVVGGSATHFQIE